MGDQVPMVSYSTGSMNSLLDKLTELKKRPVQIFEGLQQDLKNLNGDLLDKFAAQGATDEQVKAWMKQVRELVYDIEDWIDRKPEVDLVKSETEDEIKKFKAQIKEVRERCTRYGLLSKALTDREIADEASGREEEIKIFEDQIEEAPERCTRYGVVNKAPTDAYLSGVVNKAPTDAYLSGVEPSLFRGNAWTIVSSPIFEEKTHLVAVVDQINELEKHLLDEEKMLKVVSVVGIEGLGKTTLAKEISAKLQGQFDCQAFVKVGWRPSMRATLMDILRQVRPENSSPKKREKEVKLDLQNIMTELWEYLGTKRYFILVDGLWSTQAWKVINCALPDKNNGSRVLTTTCIIDVAKFCSIHPTDVIYEMKTLSKSSSRILFDSRMSVDEEGRSAGLLKICDGVPLAIIVAAGLLGSKSAELAEPKMVRKSIALLLEKYSSSQGMTKILHMSYADLSLPAKSCFLYLSVFPEDYIMRKDRLIRLWVAEGFVPKREDESFWETGEGYFNQLVSRRLIQPVFNYDDAQAVSCTVHGMILDFIRDLSSKDNFVTVGAHIGSGLFPCSTDTIRRFSLDCYGDEEEDDTLVSRTAHLSKVRSLTVLEDIVEMANRSALTVSGVIEGRTVLPSFKLIRVLDLEGTDNLRSHHLQGIKGLVLLRHLGLGGAHISQLPEEIGELEQLETLDLRHTINLSTLPASIVKLKRLVCLLLVGAIELPSDIGKLQRLEEVSTIAINSSSSIKRVLELLRKSKRLRVLGVRFNGSHPFDETSAMYFLEEVASSTELRSLSLEIDCFSISFAYLLRRELRRFELKISGRLLGGMYGISCYNRLTHMDIEITDLEARSFISVLGYLHNLVLLKLVSSGNTTTGKFNRSKFRTVKKERCIIHMHWFARLQVLVFKSKAGGIGLEFTEGAMPQLRRLKLGFSALETLLLHGNFYFGIEHLSRLTRLDATIDCKSAKDSEVNAAEDAIRNQARKFPIEPTMEFSRTNQDKTLRDKGKTGLKMFSKK